MKRANRILLTSIYAVVCLLGAAHWFHTKPIFAQQDTQHYDDGSVYIYAWVDVDSNYYLYTQSYTQWEFDAYEDIDGVQDEIMVDQDQTVFYDDYAAPGVTTSDYGQLKSNNPVATGHEYGVTSIGYVCIDDEEGGCTWSPYPYASSPHASVNVAAVTPQISNLSTTSVYQGDQGTVTITGSNFIENSSDHLTLNFSGGGSPFTLTSTPSRCTTTCTATFSYNFSGYAAGSYTLSVTNNEGTSNSETFTVISNAPQNPAADPCAVTSNPQAGYSSIVNTATSGGSGTMSVSFSGTAFAAISSTVSYGPNSTPSSIAASIAALISKNYYRYGLGAKAFGPLVVYSGNTTLGTVNNFATGPSFTTTTSSTAAAEAENVCGSAPPPPQSMYAVAYSAYIPVDHVTAPDQCTYVAASGLSNIGVQLLYRGDAYHNTYRVTQAVSLNFAASQASGYFNDTGSTENYGFGSPYNGPSANLSSQDNDAIFADYRTTPPTGIEDCFLKNAIGKASTNGWLLSPSVTNTGAIVGMAGSGQNPLSLPFGAISWSMTTTIDAGSSTGHVAYLHTCYPAHQVKVANTTLYAYPTPDNTAFSNNPLYIVRCLTGVLDPVEGVGPTKPIH